MDLDVLYILYLASHFLISFLMWYVTKGRCCGLVVVLHGMYLTIRSNNVFLNVFQRHLMLGFAVSS